MELELRKTFRFEASHVLHNHPGKCSRLHGHSWVLHVYVQGPISKVTGFVMDYTDISAIIKPLIDRLDHRHLGGWGHILTDVADFEDPHAHDNWRVEGLPASFYPTSENLLVWIGEQLVKDLNWSKLQLEETCTSLATITRDSFDDIIKRRAWDIGS